MSDYEAWKVQASVKFGSRLEGLLNIRGDTAGEVARQATDAAGELPAPLGILVTALSEEMPAVVNVAAGFPGTTQVQQQPAQQPAQGGALTCVHGTRIYRQDKANPPGWKAHFCPQPKEAADRCKPVYVN